MILTLIDGVETVFLAVILRSAREDRTVQDILAGLVSREKVPELLTGIRRFAKATLERGDLKQAADEMEHYLNSPCTVEKKGRYQRK